MNEHLVINGGMPVNGDVYISGSKNSAVAVLAAALLCEGVCTVENLPIIEDVAVLKKMMESLGARVEVNEHTARIDASGVCEYQAPRHLVRRMRASNYLIGALLGRLGRAQVGLPGGCDIGARPMDLHEKGLKALGAEMRLVRGEYVCTTGGLTGAEIYLDQASVGASINIMLAACKAKGRTIIVNAAREPHVVDVANFLNSMGANIKGAGTDTIRIVGVEQLHGSTYSILPDMIETGTWMTIAAATQGDITIHGCVPFHMESVSVKLMEMGMYVEEGEDYLRVRGTGPARPVSISTTYYPGFPTDLQQPFAVLLSVAKGTSVITENIFESRYKYIDELRRMGAKVRIADRIAIIEGTDCLYGTDVTATDLRASAALIVAGLMAQGTTNIYNIKYIDRGYENIEEKLRALGADITRVKERPGL